MVLSAFVFITADVQRPATSAKGLMEFTLEASLDRTSPDSGPVTRHRRRRSSPHFERLRKQFPSRGWGEDNPGLESVDKQPQLFLSEAADLPDGNACCAVARQAHHEGSGFIAGARNSNTNAPRRLRLSCSSPISLMVSLSNHAQCLLPKSSTDSKMSLTPF